MKRRNSLDRKAVIEAIERAAKKLGRPPHRGELPRVAGISHSAVLKHFATLRDAVRAAGLEPSRQGLKVAREELLKDFARVAETLGHAPNRNEYVRQGKYAAGTMYANFGSWPGVVEAYNTHRGGAETRRTAKERGRELTGIKDWPQMNAGQHRWDSGAGGFTTEGTEEHGEKNHLPQMNADEHRLSQGQLQREELHEGDKAIAMQWAGAMTALPGELAGKRRVTDAVCAMIVNTLIGAENDWRGKLGQYLGGGSQHTAIKSTQQSAFSIQPRNSVGRTEAPQPGQERARVNGHGTAALLNEGITSGGILDDELPVMGPPFYPCALSNAPANEMGVMILFGMLAGELGFQIEAVQGKYPDIHAKRQIQPGRWQWVRIEVEYESRNFALHGHDPEKCDIVVCWRHNWAKCPKHVEVIELSKMFG